MPRAAAAKCNACIPARPRSRSAAPLKKTKNFALQFREGSFHRFAPGIEDDSPLGTQLLQMQANGFAHTPPDPVAHHRLAERARGGETDFGAAARWLADAERREERARKAGTLIVDAAEIRGSQQADTFRKARDAYLSELTVSLWRPRARRRAKTARPFLVSIRVRNPCVLARRRLFG